jgi:hypothetical protein
MVKAADANRYTRIMEEISLSRHSPGATEDPFRREDP